MTNSAAHRWAGVPRRVRVLVVAVVVVFAYGGIVHLGDLLGVRPGGPDASTPTWLLFYFTSLTVLDPLAALLLALRRVEGLLLGCAILVTDAAANGYANYVLDPSPGITPGRIGQSVITLLAVALIVATPRIAPWLHGPRRIRTLVPDEPGRHS
ncbi:hypothetical protein C1I95_16525 [Micromonospora craterilacus]|uniref:Uncharacterized protein n=1 Tax=Micromonospora craterilacus TaxID=1655439 RepID=A0A2W2E3U3_9ACTN|nr:hypothetical protein [Micromonospora craterilacus]PZG16931.1 hypothetical protein C1I95_16525 [Micromonospora craterilacus]